MKDLGWIRHCNVNVSSEDLRGEPARTMVGMGVKTPCNMVRMNAEKSAIVYV